MKQTIATLIWLMVAVSALSTAPAFAVSYKWVDRDGKVHYSQTPPPSGKYETIRDPHPAPEDAVPLSAPGQSPKTAAEQKPDAESAEAACRASRERLAALENNAGRLVVKQADGTMHQISEAERQSFITETNARIASLCK